MQKHLKVFGLFVLAGVCTVMIGTAFGPNALARAPSDQDPGPGAGIPANCHYVQLVNVVRGYAHGNPNHTVYEWIINCNGNNRMFMEHVI